MSRRLVYLGLALALAGAWRAGAQAPVASTGAAQAHSLIADLGDEDPAVRERAAAALSAMGPAARPMLLEASRSHLPETRARAADLLLKLPWFVSSDPAPVQSLLQEYGRKSPEQRRETVRHLGQLSGDQGFGPLLRALPYEPDESVRWTMVAMLRKTSRLAHWKQIRESNPPGDSPAMLTLSGRALLREERARAEALFRRAIQAHAARPVADDGELSVAFETLTRSATAAGKLDEAAGWLRQQCRFSSEGAEDGVPRTVAALFAFHADHGPAAGYAEDLRTYREHLAHPQILYCLARTCQRQNRPIRAAALEALAFALSGTSQQHHYDVGDFLTSRGWDRVAQLELQAALWLGDGAGSRIYDANCRLRLSRIAVRRGDEYAAAEHLRLSMELCDTIGGAFIQGASKEEILAEVQYRYLKAAQTRKNVKAVETHLSKLVELLPTDTQIVLEVVPMLRQRQRDADAEKVFAAAYDTLRARLDESPEDPEHMNNLAWLCARCGQRLDEALALATTAVKLSPDNAAFLDTAAEANFALGRRAEAIRLETRALQLLPDNAFMRDQLKRFQGQ